ncbi:sensor histidine kinase [Acetobacter estunensis]|uniref:sensor histidine kinase n=1 Tax=Acetobacter estunensis TaxID=104097 RepID=UPI001C2D7A0E|nr:sensor histidine kinase [Acetobacter estunensis]MBV1838347.1 sensor histidine kinase [Acetobacter estunensis]
MKSWTPIARLRSSGTEHLLDSVRSRMLGVILGSVLPIAALGTVLIWQDYERLADSGNRRVAAAFWQIDSRITQDIERTRNMLRTIDQTTVDMESVWRFLRLAQSASGMRYCLLAMVDGEGRIRDSQPDPFPSAEACPGAMRDLHITEAPENSFWTERGRPYLRVVMPARHLDLQGRPTYFVAVEPVDWHFPSLAGNPSLGDRNSSVFDNVSAWFVLADGQSQPLCSGCEWPEPQADLVAQLAQQSRAHDGIPVWESRDQLSYAFGPTAGIVNLLVIARRLPAETRALQMLGGWIALVSVLLMAGLLGVMIVGRRLVTRPLHQLTDAVRTWEKTEYFDAAIGAGMPREFRQLSWTFGTATRRLARRETELRHALERQRALIAEIHHRVKNNLQIVGSLLSLQGNRSGKDDVRSALLRARERVRTLAILQRHLYVEGDLENLNMAEFLPEMGEQMMQSADDDVRARVTLELDVEPVILSPGVATPIVLIVSELVTNALAHAFPDGRYGSIRVSLAREEDRLRLEVADDGIGLGEESGGVGLGLQLVRGFARQLSGQLAMEEGEGSRWVITCPMGEEKEPSGDGYAPETAASGSSPLSRVGH